ncbi:N-acetyltransferase [Candidatus Peregrinibacteria bacterium]|nr:N-acetyltransferase [Candidatus Peregrinibacteria bacterium]
MDIFIEPSATVSEKSKIGHGTKIWNLSQVREDTIIGKNCILAKNVYIDFTVQIGDNVKIQNNSSIYHGAIIEDGVFIGPHVVVTNDKIPRAINADGSLKSNDDWTVGKTRIKKGASIGAQSVILPGVTVGEFALVGAGSVVTKDIPPHAMAFGNPAKIAAYVCFCGEKLDENNHCSKCNQKVEINK